MEERQDVLLAGELPPSPPVSVMHMFGAVTARDVHFERVEEGATAGGRRGRGL